MRGKILSIAVVTIVALLALGSELLAAAPDGTAGPESGPASTYSYTLQDLWNRLTIGAAGGQSAFTEPVSGPLTPTMHTLNELMAAAPTADNTQGATTADVALGKTFWGLRNGAWGLQMGIGITATNSAPVPQTGQSPTVPLDPAPAGSDGALQFGIAWPSPHFTDNGNGTVTDGLTGLTWLQKASCGDSERVWEDALAFANALYDGWTGDGSNGDCNLADHSVAGDWRLPNVRELQSLIDYGRYDPALPLDYDDYFTGVLVEDYWSSTTVSGRTYAAWYVYLYDGTTNLNAKTNAAYTWPVRGGQ